MLQRTRSLQLILDLRCNNNCTICGASWPLQPCLDTEQAIQRLQRGIHMDLREVVFSGGEVTLRHDLLELIQAARRLGYTSIVLLTNGRRLANPDYLEALARAGITCIGTSLHGHTAEVHERITRSPHSFEQAVAGIKATRSILPEIPLSVNCALNGDNYRYTVDIVRFLLTLDVRLVQLTYVVPVGRAKGIYFQLDTPSMSDTLPFVQNAVDIFLEACHGIPGASITLAFFPYCILRGLERFSGDIVQSMSYFASVNGELFLIDDEVARQNLKAKRLECTLCHFSKLCDGVWQEYVDAKDWTEFVPIVEYSPEQVIG
jgi:MoaA/NifB/PqqE/SkfB family radical SAM enzyme